MSDDAFVREIDDEIQRVKELKEERVKYMTYEMKLEEEREEGRKEGEGRLLKLFNFLIANGKQDEIERATKDPDSLPRLYAKYDIA